MGTYLTVWLTNPDGTADEREDEYGCMSSELVSFRIGSGGPWPRYFIPVYVAGYRRIQLLEPWNTEALAAIEAVLPLSDRQICKEAVVDPSTAEILAEAGLGPIKELLFGEKEMSIDLIREASVMMESLRDHLAWEEKDLDDTPWSSEARGPVTYCSRFHMSPQDLLAGNYLLLEVFDAFDLAAQESFAYAVVE
ncbi:hypothetical protein KIPB_005043 [Kipferlia bialata]|uniref:Uncharacterized protein n=1 Tax=Kipferlia bialata TaxID=797122 RepID=A0A9K3CVF5_9EUKA|nr:hypothetical protein KIPB_005043 [Kipferlia bialata]|eukprot:g5043.t1